MGRVAPNFALEGTHGLFVLRAHLGRPAFGLTFPQVDDIRGVLEGLDLANGGFIPGVRPGHGTAVCMDRVLARLTLPGAIYLTLIAALPTILIARTTATFAFGGTSLLIVIGVALDTVRQAQAQAVIRNYGGYLKQAA